MPDGHDGETAVGAIVFAHGFRGSAAGTMKNKALGDLASELGVALIATKSAADDWNIPGVPEAGSTLDVDELAYFDDVMDDAAERFPIDRERLMATGFSAGGMMVWNLICGRSDQFAGFAPMAGTFWEPTPKTCTAPPASVVHIHGDDDKIVPLEGRAINEAHQGNILTVLDMYRNYGGYGEPVEAEFGPLRCQQRTNGAGDILEFCLFSGGHSFSVDYVRHAWRRLQEIGRL